MRQTAVKAMTNGVKDRTALSVPRITVAVVVVVALVVVVVVFVVVVVSLVVVVVVVSALAVPSHV